MDSALLKESFDLIVPQKEAFAHSFYERLFTDYPETKQLFAKADMKKQENILVATLATVVAGINQGDDLTSALQQLGSKHKHYGAIAAHYPIVGSVLLATLQEYLGSQFTPAIQDTWSQAFEVISSEMLAGANKGQL